MQDSDLAATVVGLDLAAPTQQPYHVSLVPVADKEENRLYLHGHMIAPGTFFFDPSIYGALTERADPQAWYRLRHLLLGLPAGWEPTPEENEILRRMFPFAALNPVEFTTTAKPGDRLVFLSNSCDCVREILTPVLIGSLRGATAILLANDLYDRALAGDLEITPAMREEGIIRFGALPISLGNTLAEVEAAAFINRSYDNEKLKPTLMQHCAAFRAQVRARVELTGFVLPPPAADVAINIPSREGETLRDYLTRAQTLADLHGRELRISWNFQTKMVPPGGADGATAVERLLDEMMEEFKTAAYRGFAST